MGEVVQGASLGAALELLFMSVFDAAHKLVLFESRLTRLKSTLSSIKLVTDDFADLNRSSIMGMAAASESETENEDALFTRRVLQGEEFIQKCSRVEKWNLFKRVYYAHKLTKLQASLDSFFQIDVAALQFRETKRISRRVSSMEHEIHELANSLKTINQSATNCVITSSEQELDQPFQGE